MAKLKTSGKKTEKIEFVEGCGNVFEDLGFGEESVNLLLRSNLIIALTHILKEKGWSNSKAAKALGVKESRVSELRHGHIEKFSVDLLLKYLARLGKTIEITVKDLGKVA